MLTEATKQRVLVERLAISWKLYIRTSGREGQLWEGLSGDTQTYQWLESMSSRGGIVNWGLIYSPGGPQVCKQE